MEFIFTRLRPNIKSSMTFSDYRPHRYITFIPGEWKKVHPSVFQNNKKYLELKRKTESILKTEEREDSEASEELIEILTDKAPDALEVEIEEMDGEVEPEKAWTIEDMPPGLSYYKQRKWKKEKGLL